MNVHFPRIEPLGGNRYRLFDDYQYEWIQNGNLYKIIVPSGFTCDLASIPRLLWIIVSPFDFGPAAVPHDWIYSFGGKIPPSSCLVKLNGKWMECDQYWSRKDADRLFARIMKDLNLSEFKKKNAYKAVRIFGSKAWGINSSKEINKKRFRLKVNSNHTSKNQFNLFN